MAVDVCTQTSPALEAPPARASQASPDAGRHAVGQDVPSVTSLRVLMIGPTPYIYGGISAVVGAILDSELPRRHRLIYLAEGTRQRGLAKLWRFAVALLQMVWLLLRHRLSSSMRSPARNTDHAVDVLHLHVGDGGSFYRHVLYLALGRIAAVPVLFHWHLPGDAAAATSFYRAGGPLRRWLVHWALNSASQVVVLSPSWRPALAHVTENRHIVALLNPVNCAAIHPPVDLSARSRETVLFLGDFSARKGVRDLLAAVPAVLARQPHARFLICGGEPPVDVRALAAPIGPSVQFPGFVRGAEKLRLLQEATVLVLPSHAEGVPIAILEGMAAGLPVIATPVGGVPDIIAEGRNGLLVPPGDPSALAAAISRLLADPDLRRQMGQRNRRRALAQFDLPVYAQKLSALYAQASPSVLKTSSAGV